LFLFAVKSNEILGRYHDKITYKVRNVYINDIDITDHTQRFVHTKLIISHNSKQLIPLKQNL